MPSNRLILYYPLLLQPLIFSSIRVFSNESSVEEITLPCRSVLRIKWNETRKVISEDTRSFLLFSLIIFSKWIITHGSEKRRDWSWVMWKAQDAEGQREEKREYFEATNPAMNCAWLSWWICSQKWGVVVSTPRRVSWNQMAGVCMEGESTKKCELLKAVGNHWRVYVGSDTIKAAYVYCSLRQAWLSNHSSSTPYLRLWSWTLLLFAFWGVPWMFTMCHVISCIG